MSEEVMGPPAPPQKPFPLEKYVGDTLANTVRTCPDAASLRGHLLAKTGLWVPDSVRPDEVLAFLETNLPAARPDVAATIKVVDDLDARRLASTATPTTTAFIDIPGRRTGTESGTASYTADRTETGGSRISLAEVRHAISRRALETTAQVRDLIKELALDNFDYDDVSVYNYSYSEEDAEDEDMDYEVGDEFDDIFDQLIADYPDLDLDNVEEDEEEEDDDEDEEESEGEDE